MVNATLGWWALHTLSRPAPLCRPPPIWDLGVPLEDAVPGPQPRPPLRMAQAPTPAPANESNDGASIRDDLKTLNDANDVYTKSVEKEVDAQDAKSAATAAAADCPHGTARTAPFRPGAPDVGLVNFESGGTKEKWFNGCTATQVAKNAMQDTRLSLIPEALRFCRALPRCDVTNRLKALAGVPVNAAGPVRYKTVTRTGIGQFNEAVIYNDPCGDDCTPGHRKAWDEKDAGGIYSVDIYLLLAIQAAALSSTNRVACAALLTPTLGALLDLQDINGGCELGTPFRPPLPREPYQQAREALGTIQGECVGPWDPGTKRCRTIQQGPLTPAMVAALHAAHDAHACASDAKCGIVRPGGCPSATAAHKALEALGRDEEEHGFLRPADFFGGVDPRWGADDVCTGFRIADDLHAVAMQCTLDGDWACAIRAWKAHRDVHFLLGFKSDVISMRYPGEPADVTFSALLDTRMKHPNLTARQWFDEYRSSRPAHRAELARLSAGSPPL